MKKTVGFLAFASVQIVLVVLHIHKRSLFVRELYQEQRTNSTAHDLELKKQKLAAQLYVCKNPEAIKEFATHKLSMNPIALTQIKTVESV